MAWNWALTSLALAGFDLSSTASPSAPAHSPADLALVRAVRAWGDQQDPDPESSFWSRFSPAYRARLTQAWAATSRLTPEVAWQTLLHDQQESARFDPARVHSSWFARILEAESPAVRQLVAHHAPEPIRSRMAGLPSTHWAAPEGESSPGLIANPVAIAWALTLWAERLVGDVAEVPDEPPIILALSRFSIRDLVRLAKVVGQVKQAFAISEGLGPSSADEEIARATMMDRVRVAYFRRMIGRADPRLVPLARGDFAAVAGDRRRTYAAVGLITLSRLLKACDPRRARWAIQHLPYSVARRTGAIGDGEHLIASGLPPRAIRAWEAWILEAAWARLLSERRIGSPAGRTHK